MTLTPVVLTPKPASQSLTLKGINTTQAALVGVIGYYAALAIAGNLAPNSQFTKFLNTQEQTVTWVAGLFGVHGLSQARAGRIMIKDLWTKDGQAGPDKSDFIVPEPQPDPDQNIITMMSQLPAISRSITPNVPVSTPMFIDQPVAQVKDIQLPTQIDSVEPIEKNRN